MADPGPNQASILNVGGQVLILARQINSLTRLRLRAQHPTVMKMSGALAPRRLHIGCQLGPLGNDHLVCPVWLAWLSRLVFAGWVHIRGISGLEAEDAVAFF